MSKCYGTFWQREKLTEIPEYGIALTSDGDIKYVPERTCAIVPTRHGTGICSNCGEELTQYDGFNPFEEEYTGNFCLNCGAHVKEVSE